MDLPQEITGYQATKSNDHDVHTPEILQSSANIPANSNIETPVTVSEPTRVQPTCIRNAPSYLKDYIR